MDFSNQVALVTGGSRGIGRAVVVALAQRGAKVAFCYHERIEAVQETIALCDGLTGEVIAYQADVRDTASVAAFVDDSLQRWERIDALINCTSIAAYAPIEVMQSDDWQMLLETNLTGTYHTCRAVLRPMMKQRYGRIVNVSGLQGKVGFPGQTAFCASMGGILGFTRSLARELVQWNIMVNAVAPGFVDTELLHSLPNEMLAWGEQTIAQRRIGEPHEVAAAAVFLASPLASYITGQTLAVDGGWTMT